MTRTFALYDTTPTLDDCPESLVNHQDNLAHSLENHPTIPCPPPEEESISGMPREWLIWYHDTHCLDD